MEQNQEKDDVEYAGKSALDLSAENVTSEADMGLQKGKRDYDTAGNMDDLNGSAYIWIRIIECFCFAIAIFGVLWEGTERLQLTFPQFMMLYGVIGAIVSEILARFFQRRSKKKRM